MNFNQKELEEKQELKITSEELRKFRGCDKISDFEVQEIIESLFRLAIITYNLQE